MFTFLVVNLAFLMWTVIHSRLYSFCCLHYWQPEVVISWRRKCRGRGDHLPRLTDTVNWTRGIHENLVHSRQWLKYNLCLTYEDTNEIRILAKGAHTFSIFFFFTSRSKFCLKYNQQQKQKPQGNYRDLLLTKSYKRRSNTSATLRMYVLSIIFELVQERTNRSCLFSYRRSKNYCFVKTCPSILPFLFNSCSRGSIGPLSLVVFLFYFI